ncbi:ADP-ribosylarginine hydrolase Tri1-like [Corticium candelabrum]|uniref:ADP-ribosylarginine hydrolase Tri1-like n=1 Tax=Corticium candelabrum TaxID=121492 RepID=UPI002E26277B|nr:ADP-ribosylarginine hydrolase Tri1-like [Corticium candelabrum]
MAESDTVTPKSDESREEAIPEAESAAEAAAAEKATSSEPHVVQETWSKLGRDVLIDKIKGVIYGQALGDAMGLATEFMSRDQAKRAYGLKGPSSFEEIVNDFHRSRWLKGDWTDDTDQMLLILIGAIENKGQVLEKDFAARLLKWMQSGFPELGDFGGMGVGSTVLRTVISKEFCEDPHTAAYKVWEESGKYLAANGAIMRTSVLGVLNFNDLPQVIENTKKITLATHADPRCVASCVAVTTAIAMMLQGCYDTNKADELKSMVEQSVQLAKSELEDNTETIKELERHVWAKKWSTLGLDEEQSIGYTYKALGAGFFGLRNFSKFEKAISELVMQAGDADSNCAVCGALLGCKLGYNALPIERLQMMPHIRWLDDHVARFLDLVGLSENSNELKSHEALESDV